MRPELGKLIRHRRVIIKSWNTILLYHQEGKTIHFLVAVGAHIDLKAEFPHGGINIHGHGLGRWPGHAGLFAGFPVAAAFLAKAAGIHKKQKGALESG